MMKQFLLTAILVVTSITAVWAQALVVQPANMPITIQGYYDENEIVAHATVLNNTGSTVSLKWQRTVNNLSQDWSALICDAETCWGPNTHTNTVVLPAGQTSLMDCHFRPNDAPGVGNVTVKAWVVGDSAATVQTIEYECSALILGISEPYPRGTISVYPNPANNYTNITFSAYDQVRSIEIHNIIGNRVASYTIPASTETYYVNTEELQEGLYFVSLYNEQRKRVSTKAFSKVR
ncbi:MAG: T9SS type A sorting domain-containing protein [Sphingobacteriales bacterium]|nr:T9SS type A sorting domain-containing protein [Sphingobacteriales bacterium]